MLIEAWYALRAAASAPIISVITEGELRSLALQWGWGAARLQAVETWMGYLTVVPLPFRNITDAYARIADYSRRVGVVMGQNDLWIAATAHITGARLLTTDNDFDHLQDVFLQRDWIDPKTI